MSMAQDQGVRGAQVDTELVRIARERRSLPSVEEQGPARDFHPGREAMLGQQSLVGVVVDQDGDLGCAGPCGHRFLAPS